MSDINQVVFLEIEGDGATWCRTAAFDPEDDRVLVPAELCAEKDDVLRTIEIRCDNPPEPWIFAAVKGRGTLFMRAGWLATAFPAAAADMIALEAKIRATIARLAH